MIKLFLRLFFFLTVFFNIAHALTQNPYPFTATTDANRFHSLTQNIRCVVCQNQNIADSNAPLANDLRQKIYAMIRTKKSDEEIKNYLVERYGEFILLQPRFNLLTSVLWLFPFLGLFIAFLLIFLRFFSKR